MTNRASLWVRVSLLGVAIAVVTGVVAGVLAVGLIRSADERSARRELGRLADAVASSADTGTAGAVKLRVLGVVNVKYGRIGPLGKVTSKFAIVRAAVTPDDTRRVLAGNQVHAIRSVDGHPFYLEARPTRAGAVVLVQARRDATAGGQQAINRIVVAILVGVGAAALLGIAVAVAIARPLRRTAQAAHALAAGRRDVAVPLGGPAEVAEVADAVNTLAAALSHSEARQREFLLSVSHDLRTPLTAITGYAESLAGEVVPPERVPEVGATVLGEAHRLTRLVGDLLDLARLDAQDFRVDLAAVDLAEVASGAAPVWDARCRAAGVVFALDASRAPAWTDASRVRQVLDGLLDNALRVTPPGRPIVVEVRADPDGWARAEVRDGGPGLHDDDLAVAFDRSALYERYRGVRQVGTGLGLAIVHRLVTRLGGTVEAGHAREGGARFTVRLPSGPPTS